MNEKIYGSNIEIKKLECIGHVQKKMEIRLGNIVKEKTGRNLEDGKTLGGKVHLTKAEIDKIQKYYGLAIRRHPNNLAAIKKAIWATYFHKLSTDSHPQHGLCPSGPDSCCKFEILPVLGWNTSINIHCQWLS